MTITDTLARDIRHGLRSLRRDLAAAILVVAIVAVTLVLVKLNRHTAAANGPTGASLTSVTKQVTGRYLLIWITDLPPLAGSSGRYEALIYDVTVHGFPARQSG